MCVCCTLKKKFSFALVFTFSPFQYFWKCAWHFGKQKLLLHFGLFGLQRDAVSKQASKQIIVDETCFPTRTIATKWKRDPLTNSRRRTLVALLCVVYHYHHFSFQSLLMLPPGCWLAWQQCKSRHFLFSYLKTNKCKQCEWMQNRNTSYIFMFSILLFRMDPTRDQGNSCSEKQSISNLAFLYLSP